jgi:exodeoxyribonuclease VII large subunit
MLCSRAVAARRHVEQLSRSRILRNPRSLLYDRAHRLDELDEQAVRAVRRRLKSARDRLSAIACRADALSPLAVLGRGYSVTTDAQTGAVINSADNIYLGQQIRTRMKFDAITSRVESIEASSALP